MLVVQAGIGLAAFDYLVPIAIVVCVLLVIVVLSYRQTIYAYPSGGGAYVVSGRTSARCRRSSPAPSLLTDYILTVAVSVAGGVLAIQSAFELRRASGASRCACCLIAVMTVANLRGLKESGALFAPPTYLYIVMLMLLIVVGVLPHLLPGPRSDPARRAVRGGAGARRGHGDARPADAAAGVLVGCRRPVRCRGGVQRRAGVPQAGEPQRGDDLAIMAGHPRQSASSACRCWPRTSSRCAVRKTPTGIALMAEYIYGGKNVLFWVTQLATFAILILAANTAYAELPAPVVDHRPRRLPAPPARQPRRQARVLQRHHLPRRHGRASSSPSSAATSRPSSRSTRSACSPGSRSARPAWSSPPPRAGAAVAGLAGDQRRRLRRHRHRRPRRRRLQVHRGRVDPRRADPGARGGLPGDRAALPPSARRRGRSSTAYTPPRKTHLVVVLVGTVNKGVLQAVQYARSLAPERLIAVSVVTDAEEQERLAEAWADHDMPIELHTISSPYRELTQPVLEYLDELDAERPRRRHHGRHPGVRDAVEDAVAAQPVGVRAQGPPAVPAEHRRDVRARARRTGRRSSRRRTRHGPEWRRCSSGSRTRWPSRTRASSTCASATRCGRRSTCPAWPSGTEGKVILANGFNWQRYRVAVHRRHRARRPRPPPPRADRPRRQAPRQGRRRAPAG